MKVGILTFSSANNYGAALQCRCLYEVLKGMGHDTYVIDYKPAYLTEPYKIWKPAFLKHPVTMLKVSTSLAGAYRRNAAFNSFREEMKSAPAEDSSFDAIIYGSDQIWNRNICKGPDPVFYAAAPFAAMARNISYAASDGDIIPSPEEQRVIRRHLHNFYRIGVREKSMQQRMDAQGIPSVVNIDPVMLAGTDVLDKICIPVKENGHVLVYEVLDDPDIMHFANNLAAEHGTKVIRIARTPYAKGANKYGPAEFISLLKNASSVVTNSFHATVLSLLYGKRFNFMRTGTKADGRIDSLLESLGDEPASNLKKLRKESLDFLCEALQENEA